MERARSDMIRAVGVDQAAELRQNGSAYAVVEVDVRYRKPARLGDDLQVVSTVDQVRASSVHIHQRVMRGSELLTDARVTAAFLDGQGRPRRQPKEWVEKFNKITTKGQ
jgi:acyl-CoA thioester hydrolase